MVDQLTRCLSGVWNDWLIPPHLRWLIRSASEAEVWRANCKSRRSPGHDAPAAGSLFTCTSRLEEQRLLFPRVHTALQGGSGLPRCHVQAVCVRPRWISTSAKKVVPMLMMLSNPRRDCLDSHNTLHLIYNSPLSGIMYNLDINMREIHKDGFAEIKSFFSCLMHFLKWWKMWLEERASLWKQG